MLGMGCVILLWHSLHGTLFDFVTKKELSSIQATGFVQEIQLSFFSFVDIFQGHLGFQLNICFYQSRLCVPVNTFLVLLE